MQDVLCFNNAFLNLIIDEEVSITLRINWFEEASVGLEVTHKQKRSKLN